MKIAYLVDRESVGGGCEYIRRQSYKLQITNDECRTFYSEKGECRAKIVDEWGADEIVVNHLKALLQLLGPFRARPRGRIRFVVHGIHLRKYAWQAQECKFHTIKQVRPVLWYGIRRAVEKWLYHRCDEIVALTETDRVDILRLYGKDLKVTVEPNTLDGWTPHLAEASELWTRLRQTRPQGEWRPRYIFIGRFDYQKGQDRWIRALADQRSSLASRPSIVNAQRSAPPALTLFIGDGETRESCQRLAADLGVADRCIFAGAVPDADRYLKCADIVVSASRWEGMPYLLMKARQLGCKILATDCPGNRDVLAGYEKWEKLEL